MEKLEVSKSWGKSGWDEFFEGKSLGWRDKDYQHLGQMVNLSDMHGSLLDAGCGVGDGLLYLKKKSRHINKFYGTDFSTEAIKLCCKNPNLPSCVFFQHDLHDPLPETYDNIICLQTLEHLEQPMLALENLIAATNKLLLVSVPFLNRRPDSDHCWNFSLDDFRKYGQCKLDARQKNIFLLHDKTNYGYAFRNSGLLSKLLRQLFRDF